MLGAVPNKLKDRGETPTPQMARGSSARYVPNKPMMIAVAAR